MCAILKSRSISAAQPHPGLVDEGGGLERMAGSFVGHLLRRQSAEFFVNDREKFSGGFWIPMFHPFQNKRELAQAFRIGKGRRAATPNTKSDASSFQKVRRCIYCTVTALLRKLFLIDGAKNGSSLDFDREGWPGNGQSTRQAHTLPRQVRIQYPGAVYRGMTGETEDRTSISRKTVRNGNGLVFDVPPIACASPARLIYLAAHFISRGCKRGFASEG
jgi:hypothetical protein